MPLSTTNAKMLEEWAPRFKELKIGYTQLSEALETKPDSLNLDTLYHNCRIAAEYFPKLKFSFWELIMLSGNLDWVIDTKQITRDLRAAHDITPIHLMAFTGNVNGTLILVGKMKMDMEHVDAYGWTIADFMAQTGNLENTVQLLKISGINPNRTCNSKFNIAFRLAKSAKVEDVITYIDKFSLDPNHVSNKEWNIAHKRAHTGDAEGTIKLIERYNLKKKAFTKHNCSYAHQMAQSGNAQGTIKLLSYLNLEKTHSDEEGYNVAHKMASFGHGKGLLELLLWAPELLDTKTNDDKTVETIAKEHNIDFAPIRQAVQKIIDEAKRVAEIEKYDQIIRTYPERIRNNEINWVNLLIELKQSCEQHPTKPYAVFDDACQYGINKLATQLAENVCIESCLDKINRLAQAGITQAQAILQQHQNNMDQLLNEWAERFEKIDVKRDILAKALNTKPNNVSLEALYQHCSKKPIPITQAWQLICLSSSAEWISETKEINGKFRTEKNRSPAHLMAFTGNVAGTITLLNQFDLDVNHQDDGQWTIANWMVDGGHVTQAIQLITCKQINTKLNMHNGGHLAFQTAKANDVMNTIKLVQELKLNKDQKNNSGCNLAHRIAANGNLANTIKIIDTFQLDKKAVTIKNSSYAMIFAKKGNAEDTIKLVNYLEVGKADVNLNGSTIAHVMAEHSDAANLQTLLLWAPELIDLKTNDGKTVDSIATENKIDFAPIRQAVQKSVEYARIAVEIKKHADIIATYPQRILNSEPDWEKLLFDLKNSCESHPEKPVRVFDEACRYQINRLKRQLCNEDNTIQSAAITSLMLLDFQGIPQASKIMKEYHGYTALNQAIKLKSDIQKNRRSLFAKFNASYLHDQFLQKIQVAMDSGIAQACFELGDYYEKTIATPDLEKAFKAYYEGAQLKNLDSQTHLKATGELYKDSPMAAFLSLLYQGFYLKNDYYLEKAIDLNIDAFVAYIKEPTIPLSIEQKILMQSLAQQKSDAYSKSQMQSIQDELNSAGDKASYTAALKKYIHAARLNAIALQFADNPSNSIDARKAILSIVDKTSLNSGQLVAYLDHRKALAMPEDQMSEVVSYPVIESKSIPAENDDSNTLSLLIKQFVGMMISTETQKLKEKNHLNQFIKRDDQLAALEWLRTYKPHTVLTPDEFEHTNHCRTILHSVNCQIELFLQAPQLICPQNPMSETQLLLARAYIQEQIKAVIARYPKEEISLATLSGQFGYLQTASSSSSSSATSSTIAPPSYPAVPAQPPLSSTSSTIAPPSYPAVPVQPPSSSTSSTIAPQRYPLIPCADLDVHAPAGEPPKIALSSNF